MIQRLIPVLAIVVLLLGPTAGVLAGDAAAGKAKSVPCAGCHGPDGKSVNPLWPNLAGQHAEYLAKQLRDFRDGKRADPLMTPMVVGLSEEDIDNLAAYYASLSP